MKKLFAISIFIFCFSGKNISQTKVNNFENENKKKVDLSDFGASCFVGIGTGGCEWATGFGTGVAGRFRYKFFSVGLNSTTVHKRDWFNKYSNAVIEIDSKCYAATFGLGVYTDNFSASVGFGPGHYTTGSSVYHAPPVGEKPTSDNWVYQEKSGNSICSSLNLTFHGKTTGFGLQFIYTPSGNINNYAFLAGIEIGLFRVK